MTRKTSLDWGYHILNIILLGLGFGLIYLGNQVYNSVLLNDIGFWVLLASVLAFFAKNIAYMVESSEPDNLIRMKNSPRL